MAVCARLYRTVIIEHVKRTKFHLNQHILKGSRCTFHTSSLHPKSAETDLCKQLKAKIRLTGPITVAEYMKEVLTNPIAGYYMNRDVFGDEGDFITSPEISQMFGELIGIWCINEWMRSGSPSDVRIVELGPGRGTLMDDVLRAFSKLKMRNVMSVHLVEVSPTLSEIQMRKLADPLEECLTSSNENWYQRCKSIHGPEVSWYKELSDVPKGFSFYVAHEFFDALPVHIFQKKNQVWHEMLIDVDDSIDAEHHLRFVLSFASTAASKLLLHKELENDCETVEISPQTGIIVENITKRIQEDGGFALIADYGYSGEKGLTFRAFRRHQLHHPLCEPGTADLTADVNFSYFKRIIDDRVTTLGPISQNTFLQNMGITVRLQMLLKNASPDVQESLISGYKMLTEPQQMGEKFKFFAFMQHRDEYIPAGFTPL